MLSLGLTMILLIALYFLQQAYPLLAGLIAVAPIKIIGTSFMVYEEGGAPHLHEAITGMLIGQVGLTVGLFTLWLVLKG